MKRQLPRYVEKGFIDEEVKWFKENLLKDELYST